MSGGLLEAVPNFSEGRDLGLVREIVAAIEGAGAEVLDWSADRDHNRSVITLVGSSDLIGEAVIAGARVAVAGIDLRRHEGVHPRIGALDVLPFVPLAGSTMADARSLALEVAGRLAGEVGIPVYLYGEASMPVGRRLSELRRGGFEALVEGWPEGRAPDLVPPGWAYPGAHPTAGVSSVGARELLLAWNVNATGIELEVAREIAASIREVDGGFRGLRALGLELSSRGEVQISMNLEDLTLTSPYEVFERIEAEIIGAGGRVTETEVIGMIPDELVLPAASARLGLVGSGAERRLLSRRLVEYLVSAGGGGQGER